MFSLKTIEMVFAVLEIPSRLIAGMIKVRNIRLTRKIGGFWGQIVKRY